MRFLTIVKEYLTFNRKEQRGLFILSAILLGIILANAFIPIVLSEKKVDFSGFDREIAAFEKDVARADSMEEHSRKTKYKTFPLKGSQDSGKLYRSYPKEMIMIELNSADTFALQRLHGIGSSFARRIIKYRERLGGFRHKSQLLEVWGMDSSRFSVISGHLTVNPDSIHKIDLNTVTFKELLSHPYFPFETTKAIMLYRKEHKKFNGIEELRSIHEISEPAYQKIKDYVKIGN